MSRDQLYLSNIVECIGQIEQYVAGGKEVFLRDRMVQDAVIRNFEVMGEAVKRLSMELRKVNDDVPWRQMAGFRDMLIHDYLRVDMTEVWAVVERDLPVLKPRLVELLEQVRHNI
ncbi:DUF86 domain-containing protein [Leptolyngbya sp. BL0902]|uniref:HepT-like ribonuclease domain-containing protein n=1 Tax=Leptolyngbya sp. BL0902 TaxID=1115757 RepID=UPI0018E87A21|nr:DUF86 domain-containing protein [Leptolyngbya sp. BL0902]QQE64306.1 DUF86 domain-containing protein [Leptolyngbya sp. BL0902]